MERDEKIACKELTIGLAKQCIICSANRGHVTDTFEKRNSLKVLTIRKVDESLCCSLAVFILTPSMDK